MRSLGFVVLVVTAAGPAIWGCNDPGAQLVIDETRAIRLGDGRVAVEADVTARERLGGSIGTYCARATFGGQTRAVEECWADLEDGDQKTLRLASDGTIAAGAPITMTVRVDRIGEGRTLAAPP